MPVALLSDIVIILIIMIITVMIYRDMKFFYRPSLCTTSLILTLGGIFWLLTVPYHSHSILPIHLVVMRSSYPSFPILDDSDVDHK